MQETTTGSVGHKLYVAAMLTLTTLMLLRFHVIYGYPVGDSTQYNVPWSVAFSEQFWSGNLYPRWLFSYPPNLGGPVFYFYGPLPFYLLALIKGAVPGLSPTGSLTVLHALLYWCSGLAFYLWARRHVSGGMALLGACLYMGAPYHLLDLEHRNAIGEAMAFVLLPLIFRYLLDVESEGRSWLLASIFYAALIMSHLPSALLATPFMVLAVAVVYWRASVRGLWRLSVTGLGGVLLAGPYLVPALDLRDWLPSDAWLNGPISWPETWLLPEGLFFRSGGLLYGSILSMMALALLLQALVWWRGRRGPADVSASPIVLMALAGLAIVALLFTQLSVWLWTHIGPLRNVQFPFRLGVVSDFLSATMIVCALQQIADKAKAVVRWTWTVVAIAVLFIATTGLMASTDLARVYVGRWPLMDEKPFECCTQAPEYWMASVLHSRLYARLKSPEAFQAEAKGFAPLLAERTLDPDERLAMTKLAGGLEITARLSAPTDVRIAQAYIPDWRMTAAGNDKPVTLGADPETGLIVAELPAGEHRFELLIPETPAEWWGKVAGLGGLILLIAVALLPRRQAVTAADAARQGS